MPFAQVSVESSLLPVAPWVFIAAALSIGLVSLGLAVSVMFARGDRPLHVRRVATWAVSTMLWALPVGAAVIAVGYFAIANLDPVTPTNRAGGIASGVDIAPGFEIPADAAIDDRPAPMASDTHDAEESKSRGIEFRVARTNREGTTSEVALRLGRSNPDAADHAEVPTPVAERDESRELAEIDPSATAPPAWTLTPRTNDGDVTRVVLTSGQYATVEEAETELIAEASQAVREDFERRYGSRGHWAIPEHFVRTRVIRRRHEEPFVRGSAESPFVVRRVHAEVELSPTVAAELYPVWRRQVIGDRLWSLGALFGMLTLVLGTSASYLRLDALTQGTYRGRLKFASVGAIVAGGLIALLVLA